MNSIHSFTPEVCEQLKYYVYRLVDPRNGQTFYVGKGKNNRVFAHVECALDKYADVDYQPEEDDEVDLKYGTIRKIKAAGLDVIHIIQRYGMDEHDALVAESVLIDAYGVLTNKIKGYNAQDPENAITLQRDLSVSEYEDAPSNPLYIIVKVKAYWLSQCGEDRYECTRRAWKIDPERAEQYPYVLSVTGGIVREVYKKHEWHYCEEGNGRAEFTGEVAPEEVRKIFINKKIPEVYRQKGQASPCLYCKN